MRLHLYETCKKDFFFHNYYNFNGNVFFSPKIIFISSKEDIKTYSYVMHYINGHDKDGEPTLKQMEEYQHGTTIYSIMKARDYIIFPFLYAKEISSISIGGVIYNLPDIMPHNKREFKNLIFNNNIVIKYETVKPLEIKACDLYFFRIYADFTDNATFENVYIKKYPWSKKLKYEPKDE